VTRPFQPIVSMSGTANPTGVVPPPSVPLGFLAMAGVGLTGFGLAAWLAADHLVLSPFHRGVVSAVHMAVLAFLTVAVLGAIHQFGPVAGRTPIRSIAAARLTLAGIVLTAWLLPTGFAHGPRWLVPAAGLIGATTVTLAAWNLSAPLLTRDGGVPVAGLRISISYLLVTVAFGVVYALNREAGWFPLYPSRVLAHAHLGLLGWLGLAYVSVAEKLWPMFLLSHRPSARSGVISVASLGVGVAPLALGLLFSIPWMAWLGGGLVTIGLTAHVVSFVSSVRHRHRSLELLHCFLFTSMAFLVAALLLGGFAASFQVEPALRVRVVTAEVAALMAWLGLAVIGHAHKIVPFIAYTALRSQGVRDHPSGRPLLFSDLYRKAPAWLALLLAGVGFAALIVGILGESPTSIATAGVMVSTSGIVSTVNLALGPKLISNASQRRHGAHPLPGGAAAGTIRMEAG